MENQELAVEALNEAITFALENHDGYGLTFLDCWNSGEWNSIEDGWPEFNLDSDAQRWLINNSGGRNY